MRKHQFQLTVTGPVVEYDGVVTGNAQLKRMLRNMRNLHHHHLDSLPKSGFGFRVIVRPKMVVNIQRIF